jgi:hypothetical protein
VYEGKPEITKVGDCSFDTTGQSPVRLEIRRSGDQLSVTQYSYDIQKGWTEYGLADWTGEVVNEKCYRLKRVQKFTCRGQERFETTEFVAVMYKINNTEILYLDAMVVWCPASNCVFNVVYKLSRKS